MATTEEATSDVNSLLDLLDSFHDDKESDRDLGLRERKKRRQRQRISNVATALFMVQGFDNVTVARIADQCEVSEQTVFNYFPNKEAMLLDRNEPMDEALAKAIVDHPETSIAELVGEALTQGVSLDNWAALDGTRALRLFRDFLAVSEESTTLRWAQIASLASPTSPVAQALARRLGGTSQDPEVVVASLTIAGLVRARFQSAYRHAGEATTLSGFHMSVSADLRRAMGLAAHTLDSFDAAACDGPVSAENVGKAAVLPAS